MRIGCGTFAEVAEVAVGNQGCLGIGAGPGIVVGVDVRFVDFAPAHRSSYLGCTRGACWPRDRLVFR